MSRAQMLAVGIVAWAMVCLSTEAAAASARRTCLIHVCKHESLLCVRTVKDEYRPALVSCATLGSKPERRACRKAERLRYRSDRQACTAARRGCTLCCAGPDPALCGTTLIDPGTPGYDQLGAGYDVFTTYADAEFVKNKVLDLSALNRRGKLTKYAVNKFSVSQFHGTTIGEYVDSVSVSAGLSGSYGFFSGSINTTFAQMTSVTRDWSFATVQVKHRVHGLRVEKMASAGIRPFLLADVRAKLNDFAVPPATLFALYGTHVIGGLVVGGRLDYHLSALITDERQKRNVGVYAEAKLESGFASIGLSTSFDRETFARNYVANEEFSLDSLGGQGQASKVWTDGDYTAWVDTVWTNPVFSDFGADPWLIPLWELADGGCEDGSRCKHILDGFDDYARNRTIGIPPSTRRIITDIAVTTNVPSTAAGYLPLADFSGVSAQAYVHRGVSSAATPSRQHDSIFEAIKVWIAYKAAPANMTTDPPINQLHVFTGDTTADAAYGPHGDTGVEMTTDTCEQAGYWENTPCPTPLCAYKCDNLRCDRLNTNVRVLHFTHPSETVPGPPIQAIVLAGADALDTSKPPDVRRHALSWGPQDLNDDERVTDADVTKLLERVEWVSDPGGHPINLNEAADNYHLYDYECPWGCCWVNESITPSPAQYLGYVPY